MTVDSLALPTIHKTTKDAYSEVELVQESLVERGEESLLLCEHPPTITLGAATEPGDLLLPESEYQSLGIELHSVRRGGQATYHGPGQMVAYPVLNLRQRGMTIHAYLRFLENLIIELCDEYGVEVHVIDGKTGVWAENRKIAFIGVRVRKGFCYHGCSLNVTPQHGPFERIVPCGMPNLTVTSIEEETGGSSLDVWSVADRFEVLFHHRISQLGA